MTPKGIVIHCSYTPHDMDIGAKEIRVWHVDQNGWNDIGYHYVIRRNGYVEAGRDVSESGAHAKGHNDYLGICLIGGMAKDGRQACNFTRAQWTTLRRQVLSLQQAFNIPDDKVIGHNEVSDKPCPTFDVRSWMEEDA